MARVTGFVFVRHKIEPQTPEDSAHQADADLGYALRTLIKYAPKLSTSAIASKPRKVSAATLSGVEGGMQQAIRFAAVQKICSQCGETGSWNRSRNWLTVE